MKLAFKLFAAAALIVSAQAALADSQAVRMCQAECLAWFPAPSAELKACVAKCFRLENVEPRQVYTPAQPAQPNQR